jgi:hypothetical protein
VPRCSIYGYSAVNRAAVASRDAGNVSRSPLCDATRTAFISAAHKGCRIPKSASPLVALARHSPCNMGTMRQQISRRQVRRRKPLGIIWREQRRLVPVALAKGFTSEKVASTIYPTPLPKSSKILGYVPWIAEFRRHSTVVEVSTVLRRANAYERTEAIRAGPVIEESE